MPPDDGPERLAIPSFQGNPEERPPTVPILLFLSCVLIWGSTWYAITFQLGEVPESWSVAWRFLLAAGTLFGLCVWRRVPLAWPARMHLRFATLGLLLFSTSYLLVYLGTRHLASGLVAVVFSLMTPFNQIHGAIFLGQGFERRLLFGALLGIAGLGLLFLPEFHGLELDHSTALGLIYCTAAAWIASLGNTFAASRAMAGIPNFALNAWGMLYGGLAIAAVALAMGEPVGFSLSPGYLASLAWLALAGSVIAFTLYVKLLQTWGLARSGYVAVAIPVVALAISSLLEDFSWSPAAVAGAGLVALGNLVVVRRRRTAS